MIQEIKLYLKLRPVLKGLKRMNNDKKTTILGAILGLILLVNADAAKVQAGDQAEISKVVGAVVVGAIGFYINKKDATKKEPQ